MFLYRSLVDLTAVALLLLYGLLCGQMVFLRISWRQYWRIVPVLWKLRILVSYVRALVYWRVGEGEIAITYLAGVLTILEDQASTVKQKQALEMVYSTAMRMYLHCGYLEDATLLLIRANRVLQVNSLNAAPELDIHSAHLIRAGLIAGKLLRKAKQPSNTNQHDDKKHPNRQRRSGKIIPFPKKQPKRQKGGSH
ncbi:MAG: hypothetical protein OYH77_04270 [Pseudomonadota bacterium]|nr:hypothetical protein [Pseudomonadota bacterium]